MDISNKKFIFFAPAIAFSILVVSLAVNQVYAVQRGDTVQFTANTNVRAAAGTSCYGCYVITTAQSGSTASIIGGPQYANGYQWWNVRLSSGTTGWAVSNWMTVVSAPAPAPAPTLNMSVNLTSISLGQSVTVSWSSTNATSCTGSRGGSYPTSGSFSHTPPSLPYTYGMTCTGSGGSVTRSVTVSQTAASPPTLSVSVNPTSINLGESTTFSWSSTNATSCTGSRGGSYATSGSFSATPPSLPYTYGMSCTGPGGTSNLQSATVIQKTPTTQPSGGAEILVPAQGSSYIEKTPSQTVMVNWTTANLGGSNYTVSCSVSQGSVNCPSGWPIVSSQKSDSRSFQASGTGTLVFTISAPGANPVLATVVVNPLPLQPGEQPVTHKACQNNACVTVNGAGADTCTTDASCIGQVPPPTGPPTGTGCSLFNLGPCFDLFTITATTPALPSCDFRAAPIVIVPPQGSTLSWTCSNAQSCEASSTTGDPKQWSGSVQAPSGSKGVTPDKTTTYVLSCSNPDGTNTFSTTISVAKPFIKEVRP